MNVRANRESQSDRRTSERTKFARIPRGDMRIFVQGGVESTQKSGANKKNPKSKHIFADFTVYVYAPPCIVSKSDFFVF